MASENPMSRAKDFFNQEDYDRLVKEGVTEFAPWSSIPILDEKNPIFKDRRKVELIGEIERRIDILSADDFSRRTAKLLIGDAVELANLGGVNQQTQEELQKRVTDSLNQSPDPSPRIILGNIVFDEIAEAQQANNTKAIGSIINAVQILGLDKNNNVAGLETDTLEELRISLNIPAVAESSSEPAQPAEGDANDEAAKRERRGATLQRILYAVQDPQEGINPSRTVRVELTAGSLIKLVREGVPERVTAEAAQVLAVNNDLSIEVEDRIAGLVDAENPEGGVSEENRRNMESLIQTALDLHLVNDPALMEYFTQLKQAYNLGINLPETTP